MKQFFCFLIFSILLGNSISAQPLNRMTPNKMVETAEEALSNFNYIGALNWFEKAYAENNDIALLLKMAEVNYEIRDYVKAASLYERFFKTVGENDMNPKRFKYARTLKMLGKYEASIPFFDQSISGLNDQATVAMAKLEKEGALMAMKMKTNELATVKNVGDKINSRSSEYSPVLASDGNLYFSSFMDQEIVELDKNNRESFGSKILVASKEENGFGLPRMLSSNINRPGYFNSNIAVSPDATEMIISRQLLANGNKLIESKLYRSIKENDGWSSAQEISAINSNYIAKSPAYGELFGKPVLFFVSDKDGGFGGYDIYYADYIGEGKYAEPRNLGPEINTIGDEDTPFYKDGSLYFSSNGHPGMGGYDVFSSEWNAQKWSKPTNMGQPFNSSVDDLYFMLDQDGYEGYLVSNRPEAAARSLKGKTCCNDIYMVSIAEIKADLNTTIVDLNGAALNGATIALVPKTGGNPNTQSQASLNKYNFPLVLNNDYWVITKANGFINDTIEINTFDIAATTTFERKIKLRPVPIAKPDPVYTTVTREEVFVLENILYDFNDDKITTSAEVDLRFLLDLMKENPTMVIELSSHTDASGTASYNQNLSQRRAESAKDWLVNKGIDLGRIVAKGYGLTQPKTVNDKLNAKYPYLSNGQELTSAFISTLNDKIQKDVANQANRRTEFRIISGPTSIKIEEKKLVNPK